ncbi:hypothetical protein AcV7_005104 [Taiwanofungus camphoratus]|nr:hypothetical protein AcV7_005104 [Antrodia cinnamomea]
MSAVALLDTRAVTYLFASTPKAKRFVLRKTTFCFMNKVTDGTFPEINSCKHNRDRRDTDTFYTIIRSTTHWVYSLGHSMLSCTMASTDIPRLPGVSEAQKRMTNSRR